MKKLITALLTLSLVLLVGCGSDETDETTTNDPDPTADKTDTAGSEFLAIGNISWGTGGYVGK